MTAKVSLKKELKGTARVSARQRLVHGSTFLLLAAALAASIVWLCKSQELEPFVTALALIAAITGVFGERWAQERERKKMLLLAVLFEAVRNCQTLEGEPFSPTTGPQTAWQIIPRLGDFALNQALASAEFTSVRFAMLVATMLRCQRTITSTNRAFDMLEVVITTDKRKITEMLDTLRQSPPFLVTTTSDIRKLRHLLLNDYRADVGLKSSEIFTLDEKIYDPPIEP
jgi:hypothetical protein